MIVISPLPESPSRPFEEGKRGVPFESRDEAKQVCSRGASFGQKMHVIGHHAIGMQDKRTLLGLLAQVVQHPEPQGVVGEVLLAIMATNRDEVDPVAQIVLAREPDVLSRERHGVL